VSARRFVLADVPAQPWKNQGGTTREILSWPPGADLEAFAWRVSVATIAMDGPFSAFPGVDRTITLLRGDGVRLHGDGLDHRLDRPGVPIGFDGAARLDCALIDSPCVVLNVMARRRLGRARVDLVRGAIDLTATNGLLLSLRGVWQVGAEEVGPDTGLWWADAQHYWQIQPSGPSDQLAIVQWEPA
jgi:environmental stress-induced protein Ves